MIYHLCSQEPCPIQEKEIMGTLDNCMGVIYVKGGVPSDLSGVIGDILLIAKSE